MSGRMTIEVVRENFRRMSDEEFIRVVTQDGIDPTPEARAVMNAEASKRGLTERILEMRRAANGQVTIEELNKYCDMLQGLACPICGAVQARLNATMTHNVVSAIVITQYSKTIKLACPDCLDKQLNMSLLKTSLIGWWGFPWGIVRTIQAISENVRNKGKHRQDAPTVFLQGYVLSNFNKLEAYSNDKVSLQQFIKFQ